MAHDEIATYYHYIMRGNFLPYHAVWDANNHVLNSFLSWASFSIFGNHPLALRLPNILSSLVFFYFTWKLSTLYRSGVSAAAFLLILWFTHGFLEFFAFTRGYGMSMAFLAGAIWFISKSWNDSRIRNHWLAMVFMMLAVTANLTLINTMLLMLGLSAILFLKNRKGRTLLPLISLMCLTLLFLFLAVRYTFDMKARGLLYYGGLTGFREVTIKTLIATLFNEDHYILQILAIAIGLGAILAGVYLLFRYWQNKQFPSITSIYLYFFTGNLVAIFLMAQLMDVNYPEDRTGMFLYLFLIGTLCFVFDESAFRRLKYLLLLFLLVPLNFIASININRATLWPMDRIPSSFFQFISEEDKGKEFPSTIGGRFNREMTWNYNKEIGDWQVNQINIQGHPNNLPDYQLAHLMDTGIFKADYQIAVIDEKSGNLIMKRREPLVWKEITRKKITEVPITDAEYLGIIEDSISEFIGSPLIVNYQLSYQSERSDFDGWIVLSIFDSEGNQLFYDRFFTNWNAGNLNTPQQVKATMLIPEIPEGAAKLSCYLWNLHKDSVTLRDGIIVLRSLSEYEANQHGE